MTTFSELSVGTIFTPSMASTYKYAKTSDTEALNLAKGYFVNIKPTQLCNEIHGKEINIFVS